MEEELQLKAVGLKITGPRRKILQILATSPDHHLRAETVYQKLLHMGEDIGLATVYRVLTQFEAAGLVRRHYFEEDYSVYEMNRYAHHDHMVCVSCGRVDEFCDPTIEARQQLVAAQAEFLMTDHTLVLYGVCKPCQAQDRAER
ncbi:MAG: ferric iron uptake transcriptional regulator [Legionellaceae bacterium]|nr:ferric iron uptake transcriptional regulator [Legionellaceae bacterium]